MDSKNLKLEALAKELYKDLATVEIKERGFRVPTFMDTVFVLDTGAFAVFLAMEIPRYQLSVAQVFEDYPWLNDLFQKYNDVKEMLINPENTPVWYSLNRMEYAGVIVSLARNFRRTNNAEERANYQALMNRFLEFHEEFVKTVEPECSESAREILAARRKFIRDHAEGNINPDED